MTEPRDDQASDLEQALAAYLDAQRMTRRQLLERIAAVGAAAALAPVIAACAAGPTAQLPASAPRQCPLLRSRPLRRSSRPQLFRLRLSRPPRPART